MPSVRSADSAARLPVRREQRDKWKECEAAGALVEEQLEAMTKERDEAEQAHCHALFLQGLGIANEGEHRNQNATHDFGPLFRCPACRCACSWCYPQNNGRLPPGGGRVRPGRAKPRLCRTERIMT